MKLIAMESQLSHEHSVAHHTLSKMLEGCDIVISWNANTNSIEDYLESQEAMQKLAATCMLIESIGESAKKVDKLIPDFLETNAPNIPWKSVKGLRDHIAHGYFSIDADIIFDVVTTELEDLRNAISKLLSILEQRN